MRIASEWKRWFYPWHADSGAGARAAVFDHLKREDGKHFLVTPVEKVGIRVDDAPFLAVEMQERG